MRVVRIYVYQGPRASTYGEWLKKQHVSPYVTDQERNAYNVVMSATATLPIPTWIKKEAVEILVRLLPHKYPVTRKSVLALIYVIAQHKMPSLTRVIEETDCGDGTPCMESKTKADPDFRRHVYQVKQHIQSFLGKPPRVTPSVVEYFIKKHMIPVPPMIIEEAKKIISYVLPTGLFSGQKSSTVAPAAILVAMERVGFTSKALEAMLMRHGSKASIIETKRKIKEFLAKNQASDDEEFRTRWKLDSAPIVHHSEKYFV